ncbi:MAG: dUTP diphosphatase [Treponema sp.]|jgi:dUTP pyrophosphatase|nr:dUTP diphosphatase [Treponema sp.]
MDLSLFSNVKIECIAQKGAKLPAYQTEGSAGADVCAFLKEPIVLSPMQRAAIPTGLTLAIPAGYEIQVRPRSGLSLKNGITCLNTPGTIDSDYRGEIKVILINLGAEPFTVQNGDRIAQLVVKPVVFADFSEVSVLGKTERGDGGFGSTGK